MKTSILIPSAYRPDKLCQCLASVFETTPGMDIEIILSLCRDDNESLALAAEMPVTITAKHEGLTGAVLAWNEAAAVSTGDILTMIGDDIVCQEGWLSIALAALKQKADSLGVIGMNDLNRKDGARFATHILTTRRYLREYNGGVLLCPKYVHYYPDVEICERAGRLGLYTYVPEAKVDHLHHMFGRGQGDQVYQWALDYYERDNNVFNARRAAGFPNDYEAIL